MGSFWIKMECGDVVDNADVHYNTKHPILLLTHHHLTTSIARRAHERVLHNGVKETLNEIRVKYWIIKGWSFVKKLIHRCVTCEEQEGMPCHGPFPPPLLTFLFRQAPPFTHMGADFANPLHAKAQEEARPGLPCIHV